MKNERQAPTDAEEFIDEYAGQGGRYEIRNGRRVQLEPPTQPAASVPPATPDTQPEEP